MKLSIQAFTLAFAALWGSAILLTGLANAVFPPYGAEFLPLMNSRYPGYSAAPTVFSVAVGTACGLLAGGVAGLLFAWLYNRFLSWEKE